MERRRGPENNRFGPILLQKSDGRGLGAAAGFFGTLLRHALPLPHTGAAPYAQTPPT
jgi:hypothetical protein